MTDRYPTTASCGSTPLSTANSTPWRRSNSSASCAPTRRSRREYRRLAALRDAIRRHAPREAAPRALADRVAALAAPVAPPAPLPLRRRPSGGAVVRRERLRSPPPSPPSRLRCRRRPDDAQTAGRFGRRRRKPCLRFRARRNRGPAVRRRLLRPAHGQALARRPRNGQRRDRRSCAARGFRSPAGASLSSTGSRRRRSSIATREHLIAVTELPLDAAGARAGGGIETIDGYHVARWSDANLSYVAVSDMDEKTLADFVAAFRQAQKPAEEGR